MEEADGENRWLLWEIHLKIVIEAAIELRIKFNDNIIFTILLVWSARICLYVSWRFVLIAFANII